MESARAASRHRIDPSAPSGSHGTSRRLARAGLGLALALCVTAADTGHAAPPSGPEESRRMAITIDDLPASPPGRHTTVEQERITRRLLAVLAEHDVPAIGFVNEANLEVDGDVDPRRIALLERWLKAGHELGNHGYSHLDLHRVDPESWMADVVRGERVTRPLVEAHGGELRWFRHPFLHMGRSAEVQRQTADFLTEHGYRIAPVTIDNDEWVYGDAYADAWNRGDTALMRRLGEDYVRYMLEVVEYYEDQSRKIAGELIPQTLGIHAYALNAGWLGRVLDELEARGYRWISLEEAMRHPAYRQAADGYVGGGGVTWLHRWAINKGHDRAVFQGEPEAPDWVRELADREPTGPAKP